MYTKQRACFSIYISKSLMTISLKPNTTGLIFAMREEQEGLESFIQNKQVHQIAKRRFIQGQLWGHPVVMVLAGIGKVAAASTTSLLIHHFQINQLILSGVAGAADPALKVGDIVIARELLQHDMNASPLFPRFEIPLTGKSRFFVNKNLHLELQKATTLFVQNIQKYIPESLRKEWDLMKIEMYSGLVASGDQFIHEAAIVNQLKKELPDLLALEMEGAAIAQVCDEHDLEFAILRTISDNANETASIDFQSFVNQIAAPYTVGILKNYFENKEQIFDTNNT
ncbi:5'-methylthioadenosine/adenosylhomocysteine nucleosidase [Undibacterium sp. FT137W]|uniref:5'-methylthioadenosine/adenosylhomocysteine nucleosidase n=2 Tax=Undibacterium fentianense TaxID=2828728 RepID=A0A941E3Z7_9BURK|nr:5'-methylthioadenosine/adenosylhomocysteine nucleosidase [Undibacterium fentianense]